MNIESITLEFYGKNNSRFADDDEVRRIDYEHLSFSKDGSRHSFTSISSSLFEEGRLLAIRLDASTRYRDLHLFYRSWISKYLEARTDDDIFSTRDDEIQRAARCISNIYSPRKTLIEEYTARRLMEFLKNIYKYCTFITLFNSFARNNGVGFHLENLTSHFTFLPDVQDREELDVSEDPEEARLERETRAITALLTDLQQTVPNSELIIRHIDPLLDEEQDEPLSMIFPTYLALGSELSSRSIRWCWVDSKINSSLEDFAQNLLEKILNSNCFKEEFAERVNAFGFVEIPAEFPFEVKKFLRESITNFYQEEIQKITKDTSSL